MNANVQAARTAIANYDTALYSSSPDDEEVREVVLRGLGQEAISLLTIALDDPAVVDVVRYGLQTELESIIRSVNGE